MRKIFDMKNYRVKFGGHLRHFYGIICMLLLMMCQVSMLSAQHFQDAWCGRYEGRLEIFTKGKMVQSLDMALDIRPLVKDSLWTWQIEYRTDRGVDLRAYELVAVDGEAGLYQIDEKNGIVLDAGLCGGKMISHFSVKGSWIVASYTFREADGGARGEVVFEIIGGSVAQKRTTGGASEDIPEVESMPVGSYQRAFLVKI